MSPWVLIGLLPAGMGLALMPTRAGLPLVAAVAVLLAAPMAREGPGLPVAPVWAAYTFSLLVAALSPGWVLGRWPGEHRAARSVTRRSRTAGIFRSASRRAGT